MAKKAYVYSGTEWVPLASEVTDLTAYSTSTEIANTYATKAENGLVYIDTVSGTGVNALNVNDVFSATYTNYKVFINTLHTGAGSNNLTFRFRVSGSDNSSATYTRQALVGLVSTASAFNEVNLTSISMAAGDQNDRHGFDFTFYQPFLATPSAYIMNSVTRYESTAPIVRIDSGTFTSSTSFTGFSLLCDTAMTASIRVYGLKE